MEAVFNILIALGVVFVLGIIAGVVFGLAGGARKEEKAACEEDKNEELRAFVRCSGGDAASKRYTYAETPDCQIAASLYGGVKECAFACLGFGNCKDVCKNGAIAIERGVAVVDEKLCDGCGKCVSVCPRSVIELIPKSALVAVACRNTDAAYEIEKICGSGCIGCRACVNTCQYDAISFDGDLANIDYEKCTNCGECAAACERGIISAPSVVAEEEAFDENEYFELSKELQEEEK